MVGNHGALRSDRLRALGIRLVHRQDYQGARRHRPCLWWCPRKNRGYSRGPGKGRAQCAEEPQEARGQEVHRKNEDTLWLHNQRSQFSQIPDMEQERERQTWPISTPREWPKMATLTVKFGRSDRQKWPKQ